MIIIQINHRFYGYTATVVNYTMMTTCDVNYYDDHDLNVVVIWIYMLTAAAGTVEIEAVPAPAGAIVVVSYHVIPIAHSATVVD